MNSLYVDIAATDGGSFKVYLTSSDAEKAPGLVLMQYICGVNAVMRSLAEVFAAKGYLVAVPDLFWRQEPGRCCVGTREKKCRRAGHRLV